MTFRSLCFGPSLYLLDRQVNLNTFRLYKTISTCVWNNPVPLPVTEWIYHARLTRSALKRLIFRNVAYLGKHVINDIGWGIHLLCYRLKLSTTRCAHNNGLTLHRQLKHICMHVIWYSPSRHDLLRVVPVRPPCRRCHGHWPSTKYSGTILKTRLVYACNASFLAIPHHGFPCKTKLDASLLSWASFTWLLGVASQDRPSTYAKPQRGSSSCLLTIAGCSM